MAFTTIPHIIPRTELQAPTGPGAAEIASGDQIIAAIETDDITKLDYRQRSVLATAFAFLRAARSRNRPVPNAWTVGNEMSRVLTALQSSSEATSETLVTALVAADEQWASLIQPLLIPPAAAEPGEAQPEA